MHYTPTASNAWKGICKAKNIIKEGLRKRVRNGRNTSFWTEPWITGENLAWYANVEVPEEEHDATDELFWEPEANGNFSVTSAYGLIQGDIESHNDKGWERLWQVNVPNKICKGAFSSVENGPILFAITLLVDLEVAESVRAFEKISQPASNTHNKVQRLIRWTKPPDGWTKMNIDGSRDTLTGHASCGGLLRDVIGNWLLGFKAKVGHCSIEEAEAWSILKGLKTIWNHGYRKVIIESDAKHVVD
ncbi:uncharacterized protein LOC116013175 [Ipomoea triloba]|uniref:uncharacterized protein LOC116013175 n=1 Tax=Ipomoea triloba TaxID=35885 RepID=UPI00125E120E|nr:uncharacterized protein LOC116013175 [Ipomoea triloba]